jgi:hypothetical protein
MSHASFARPFGPRTDVYAEATTPLPACAVTLSQCDFDRGTVVLNEPGTYYLTEDILFHPNRRQTSAGVGHLHQYLFPRPCQLVDGDDAVPRGLEAFRAAEARYEREAYRLGFFAAIVIAADDVTLDLRGFTIQQSKSHALVQRFFAIIELADQPFPTTKGPAEFGATLRPARRVTVRNGTLGLSTHHGIHGNDNVDVRLEDLTIRQFEVAGISLNAVDNLTMRNVVVEHARRDVWVNGAWSASLNLLRETRRLLADDQIPDAARREVGEIADRLEQEAVFTLRTLRRGANGLAIGGPWGNASGLPDGSALFGIAIHSAFHIDGFTRTETPSCISNDVIMENVTIRTLRLKPHEVQTYCHSRTEPMKDAVGAVVDIVACSDHRGVYVPNPLVDLQMALTRHRLGCAQVDPHGRAPERRSKCPFADSLHQNTIPEGMAIWAQGGAAFDPPLHLPEHAEVSCGRDIMHHDAKGIVGLKLDGVCRVQAHGLRIVDLMNRGERAHAFCDERLDYDGLSVRAISVSSCRDVSLRGVEIRNLHSLNGGKVRTVDVIGPSENVDVTKPEETVARRDPCVLRYGVLPCA